MKYRFEKKNWISLCILITAVTTLSGCASSDKAGRIIAVQKNRIQNLKKQIRRQNKTIETLKVRKWTGSTQHIKKNKSLSRLDGMMKKGLWVSALKLSSEMVKKRPNWTQVRKRRVKIFKEMGLRRQATNELSKVKKLSSRKPVSRTMKRE